MVSLNDMPAGKTGIIKSINGGFNLIRKLEKMGFRVGTEITKISGQWMKGPVIMRSGNSEIAIGYGMAQKIMIKME